MSESTDARLLKLERQSRFLKLSAALNLTLIPLVAFVAPICSRTPQRGATMDLIHFGSARSKFQILLEP